MFLTWATHQEKKKHANTTMTGSPCNECSPLCNNSAGRNQGMQVCNEEKLD